MGTIELVLILIAAVLLSSLLSQLLDKISIPLIQIGLGVLIALFINVPVKVSLDPEIFLILFIAPLLFNEAKSVDKLLLWKNKAMICSLAVGLVVATMVAVGFSLNTMLPEISLAAAFALGAALGPTDAVAVSSLSSVARFSPKQKAILGGESLINDASGLVAFQFAITAAVTGEFALVEAGQHFLVEFFGGIGLGCVLGGACNLFIAFVREQGLENRTFHVLFEVALPFASFLLGDALGVSGVLTVVACGIVFSIDHKQAGINISKMKIVSSGTWDVLTFALNGVVFVLLGMMLPGGMMTQFDSSVSTIDFTRVGMALVISFVVVACRFIWVLLVERVFGSSAEISRGLLKHAAIISCAGAKGAITLSIAFTLPTAIASRDSLIFMASVAILATLLLANFAIPILAPAQDSGEEEREKAEFREYKRVLRKVMDRLADEMSEAKGLETIAYQVVIREYKQRIDRLNEHHGVENNEGLTQLRIEALHWQEEKARQLVASKLISGAVADEFIDRLDKKAFRLEERGATSLSSASSVVRSMRTAFRSVLRSFGLKGTSRLGRDKESRELQVECHRYALERLVELEGKEGYNPEDTAILIVEYQKAVRDAKATAPSVTQFIKGTDSADEIRLKAFHYEQDLVGEAYSDGRISRKSAARLRRQIAAMQLDIANEI